MTRITTLAILVLLAAAIAPDVANAKGMNFLAGATVYGGDLPAPHLVRLNLADESNFLIYVDVPVYRNTSSFSVPGCTAWPACAASVAPAPRLPGPGEVPYEIILHYDFGRLGGERERRGRFDGVDKLYFPENMLVGNGLWAAGWYRASPALRDRLNGTLHASLWSRFGSLWGEMALATVAGFAAWQIARRQLMKHSGRLVEPETAAPDLMRRRIAERDGTPLIV